MGLSDRHIHIVSFDVPFPPSYGGVIDVFYKIKALHQAGISISLHCFQYGREKSAELEKYCRAVHYYPRKESKTSLFRKRPYIILSRTSEKLTETLLRDNHPILFEGLHTCGTLTDARFAGRKALVRTHNVEHEYYRNLAGVENNIFKKLYFYNEASKLERFEEVLSKASAIAAISPSDTTHFSKLNPNTFYLPAFHPNNALDILPGQGKFALYHGNLAVGENNKAALYLVNEVFHDSDIPLVIAGSKPSAELKAAVAGRKNFCLEADITTEAVLKLVREAQVNVLPTFQATGIKLKLLSALFNGRHAVVNREMVENTGLENLCHIAPDAASMRSLTESLMQKEFNENEVNARKAILLRHFSNAAGAEQLAAKLFDR